MRRLLVLIVLGLVVTATLFAGAYKTSKTYTVSLDVTSAGDATEIIALTADSVSDSLTYTCTLAVLAMTDSIEAVWLSPLMVAYITPSDVDTTATYACSVLYTSTDIAGFEYAVPEDTVMANMIDDLVDSFEVLAAITDSITIDDSGSYIKLTADFGTETHGGRWLVHYTGDFDTTYSRTTVAMFCDSMLAEINAEDTMDYLLAVDSTDSIYITATQPGLLFDIHHDGGLFGSDTTTANSTSYSTIQDTFNIGTFSHHDMGATSIVGRFVLAASASTAHGLGLSDSGIVRIHTDLAGTYHLLACDTATSLPVTLYYSIAAADTTLKDGIWLEYRIADTTSDTSYAPEYTITVDYLLKE